jgi:DNA-binding MarR family transcriptional regulator
VDAARTELAEFRRLIQQFVRGFGFLSDDTTPCGQPIPVACAHALLLIGAQKSGALPQTALFAHFPVDKSNVSRLVARLVEMGLAKCRPDAVDRRGKMIALTAQGVRMAKKLDAASKERFGQLMQGIPMPRRAPVVAALAELVQSLSRLEAGQGAGQRRSDGAPHASPARRQSSMLRQRGQRKGG